MVGFRTMGWLPEPTTRRRRHSADSTNLGILAFETAKTMSRLVSLYKSLSDEEVSRLKNHVVKSEGVAYLNSRDEGFLLSLACAELLEDLDRAAAAVSRLGKKCGDLGLNRFDLVYADLKHGTVDYGKSLYGSRIAEKKVRKMEKLVASTSRLHSALESLTEMEVSERRLKVLEKRQIELQKANSELFNQKLENQRKEVRHYREVSLWSKTFDKSVGLMARIVFVVYARICAVFGQQKKLTPIEPNKEKIVPHSGPISATSKPVMVRFYSRRSLLFFDDKVVRNNRVFHAAGPTTVGGSGLALRYANLILLAEKYLDSATSLSHDERHMFYEMLPENLKAMVRSKLIKNMKRSEDDDDVLLAEGWRDAVTDMMRWIAPMADDTVTWQMDRNFEKMRFEGKPSVLLLQTLHFADREKTEAAIAEILVGLCCIFRFENRQLDV